VRGLGALAALLLLSLAACNGADTEARILARQRALEPPQLWLVQAVGRTGATTASTFVCADTAVRDTFSRTRTEVNGQPCRDVTAPLLQERQWSLRCQVNGRMFAVSAQTVGDVTQDFRLDFALTPLAHAPGDQTVRESLRFRQVGACPAGWRIGDQARPGHRPRGS
jgi:hypothetical protein